MKTHSFVARALSILPSGASHLNDSSLEFRGQWCILPVMSEGPGLCLTMLGAFANSLLNTHLNFSLKKLLKNKRKTRLISELRGHNRSPVMDFISSSSKSSKCSRSFMWACSLAEWKMAWWCYWVKPVYRKEKCKSRVKAFLSCKHESKSSIQVLAFFEHLVKDDLFSEEWRSSDPAAIAEVGSPPLLTEKVIL